MKTRRQESYGGYTLLKRHVFNLIAPKKVTEKPLFCQSFYLFIFENICSMTQKFSLTLASYFDTSRASVILKDGANLHWDVI